MKTSKFLALIPVITFAAACNSVVPSGPSTVASNDASEMASGGASTMSRATCTGITGVSLRIDGTNDAMLWVEAIYQYGGPVSTPVPQPRCGAPTWRSDHAGLTIDKLNPFRAGFSRKETGKATLQARAPNGVHNAIDIELSPTNRKDPPSGCTDITGVTLKLIPNNDDTRVAIEAAYEYSGPLTTPCPKAPEWFADRRGLVVNEKNPFQAWIGMRSDLETTVTATGPTGVVGSIIF
jgi:hypothetical protein